MFRSWFSQTVILETDCARVSSAAASVAAVVPHVGFIPEQDRARVSQQQFISIGLFQSVYLRKHAHGFRPAFSSCVLRHAFARRVFLSIGLFSRCDLAPCVFVLCFSTCVFATRFAQRVSQQQFISICVFRIMHGTTEGGYSLCS